MASEQGRKAPRFKIVRLDGKTNPGGKHERCEHIVLDIKRDPYAAQAMEAYTAACAEEYPLLASGIRTSLGVTRNFPVQDSAPERFEELVAVVVPSKRLAMSDESGSEEGEDPDRSRGAYRKFSVVDARFATRGFYFVLDVRHDRFAAPALLRYAEASAENRPDLSAEARRWAGKCAPE